MICLPIKLPDGIIDEQQTVKYIQHLFSTKESIVSNNGGVRRWPILADDARLGWE
jgi:hypothetical protein